MSNNEPNIVIGEITTTFGNKGEVKVRVDTDFPEHFAKLGEICLGETPADSRTFKIQRLRHHKGAVILKLDGVNDMTAAEGLRGMKIRITDADLMPLGKDEYYIHDIIGMDVVTTDGEHLGKISEVLRSPGNDVYVTDRAMIPAVKEFVVSIDPQEQKIIVRNVEGLVQE
jgi:16S rRNA processing protein RimM